MLHFNDKYDIRYYPWVAKPLFSEREDKFNCAPDNLNDFLQALDERYQECVRNYDCTGITWGNRGVIMIAEVLYSRDANRVRAVNTTANMISQSLIRDHKKIPLDLVR